MKRPAQWTVVALGVAIALWLCSRWLELTPGCDGDTCRTPDSLLRLALQVGAVALVAAAALAWTRQLRDS